MVKNQISELEKSVNTTNDTADIISHQDSINDCDKVIRDSKGAFK